MGILASLVCPPLVLPKAKIRLRAKILLFFYHIGINYVFFVHSLSTNKKFTFWG
ncbi:hypothetical protein HMPREF3213_00365 [Heyndrickxia coagulans]|uniref:Uncharacterized protein n=1 Tax=Heyndrickxia coagulans TaxID=1398 RepID=A0A133L1Y0_HEYCO|nr:hypothetical protein HMPREF3213_00365 [Heyndrickxia coagulans]KYC62482.1 hypothetical protein B4100_1533 [Heyndrickxia coagulans]